MAARTERGCGQGRKAERQDDSAKTAARGSSRFLSLRPKSGVARAIAVEVAISLAVELPCSDTRKKQGSCGEALTERSRRRGAVGGGGCGGGNMSNDGNGNGIMEIATRAQLDHKERAEDDHTRQWRK